jgi:prepilin-type N-terminal cleavage/methylation domain-containing protein/prepilin-type processing-associated H-X9-DG protein
MRYPSLLPRPDRDFRSGATLRKLPGKVADRKWRGFTLVELLVVIAIIGVLAGLLVPAVRAARASSKNAACKNNLRQMGVALDLHNGAYGCYPVDGENGFGIGAFLLPYLEQTPLYDQLKPREKKGATVDASLTNLTATALEVFVCPSFQRPQKNASSEPGKSNYIGNTHLFSKVTIFDDIIDGESNTIAMGETVNDHAWAKPRLAGPSPPSESGVYSSRHGGGANFVFCDGSVHFIQEDIDPKVFTALSTIDGRETIGEW